MATRLLRYPDSLLPHGLALAYAVLGWVLGLVLICAPAWWLNLLGVPLLAHALVIAAYMVHECGHNTVFTDNRHNARLGEALDWIIGACYGRYEDIRHKHFRHHVDRADVVSFDYRGLLRAHPWLGRTVHALEWMYIPAVDLIMHAMVLVLPFVDERRRDRRARVLGVLAVRVTAFALLGAIAPKALLLYALSYMLFLHVLRFMDAQQHTYDVVPTLEESPAGYEKPDRAFEERNTFSNLISFQHPWLNLLTLNFPYHNAHHYRPAAPWYQLPALHRQIYGEAPGAQTLSFRELLRSYHRHRVARVLNDDAPDSLPGTDGKDFIGVVGVSFLTAH